MCCRILNSPTVLLILTYYCCDKVVCFLDIAPCSSIAKNSSICSSAVLNPQAAGR